MENKGQLDATDWILLQNLMSAQHVSGAIMPIIRSSRIIQMVAAGRWSGVELHTRPTTGKTKRHVPQAATICIILELLMIGIMARETR